MSTIDDLLAHIPLDQLAERLGVDAATIQDAVSTALPALVGGLHANAQDPAGAASLENALASKDTSLIDGGVDLSQVDPKDGKKIVKKIFGNNTSNVVQQLAGTGSIGSSVIKKVLPMLAPIVLAFLAKQFTGNKAGNEAAPTEAAQSSGGGIGDLLGGLLGGGGSGGGIDIGGLLGGLLGGGAGTASNSGGGLGGLLGGLLGGKG